jgi:hypothetical protein
MCKIAVFPKVTDTTRENVTLLAKEITPALVANDKDGFGIMCRADDGSLFGKRWLDVKEAWKDKKEESSSFVSKFFGFLVSPVMQNSFGEEKPFTALALHSRMATCGKSMENTHPFFDPQENVALIHNGIISNTQNLVFKTSTCDSETILNAYTAAGVHKDIKQTTAMTTKLNGSFACAVFSTKYVDIFKNSSTSLYGFFIKEIDAIMFCTSKEIIFAACSTLKWELPQCFNTVSNKLIRFDGTGEAVDAIDFFESSPRIFSGATTDKGWWEDDNEVFYSKKSQKKARKEATKITHKNKIIKVS